MQIIFIEKMSAEQRYLAENAAGFTDPSQLLGSRYSVNMVNRTCGANEGGTAIACNSMNWESRSSRLSVDGSFFRFTDSGRTDKACNKA